MSNNFVSAHMGDLDDLLADDQFVVRSDGDPPLPDVNPAAPPKNKPAKRRK